jgi:hypothetical protein
MAITPLKKEMKHMKTKLLLTAALVGAASLSAQAGVHFGFSFGLPLPPLPVPVIYTAPAAPVYVAPAVCAPPAVVVTTPACPGPDYVWAPGYWSVSGPRRVWIAAGWQHRPSYVVYGHDYDRGHDRDDHRFNNDRDNGHGNDHDRGHDHDGYRR